MRIEIINPQLLARLLMVFGLLVFTNAPAGTKDFSLHQAVLDNDKQLVTRLLNKGAAINVIGSRKYGYGSALHLAVREGHLEIAQLLLKRGAEVDVLDPDDYTPLHNAAWNGNLEMTELLLNAGADINASTYDGDTPLSLAQINDQPQVAEFIQAKLQPSTTSDTKVESTSVSDSGVRDVSGTYVMTNLTGSRFVLVDFVSKRGSKDPHEITIAQNGDQLTGTTDEGWGKFWGKIKGDTIKFDWTGKMQSGRGVWTFKPGSNESSVSLSSQSGSGEAKFNLTKIETTPSATDSGVIDISGTYTNTELTYPREVTRYKDWMLGKGENLELTIQQSGSTVTGVFSGDLRGNIKGLVDRNEITFEFDGVSRRGSSNYGEGVLFLSEDSTELIGTFKLDSGHYGILDGKWNFRKIYAEPAQVVNLTGTYIIDLSGPGWKDLLKNGSAPNQEIRLVQNGSQITGTFGDGGKVYGGFDGHRIKFEWISWDGEEGRGIWKFAPGSTQMSGTWYKASGTVTDGGDWNLTKIK